MKTITINIQASEQNLIEGLLNMKHSGVSEDYILFTICLYAMSKVWHIDKLIYYINLLEIKNSVGK